jgi:hypothetical protein
MPGGAGESVVPTRQLVGSSSGPARRDHPSVVGDATSVTSHGAAAVRCGEAHDEKRFPALLGGVANDASVTRNGAGVSDDDRGDAEDRRRRGVDAGAVREDGGRPCDSAVLLDGRVTTQVCSDAAVSASGSCWIPES